MWIPNRAYCQKVARCLFILAGKVEYYNFEEKRKTTKDKLMKILADTSKKNPMVIFTPLPLSSSEDMGLSDNEKPELRTIWKGKRKIFFTIYGSDEIFDLSDYKEYEEQIYKALSNE